MQEERFVYENIEELKTEIKKIHVIEHTTYTDTARIMGMSSQAFNSFLGKKNFSFDDLKKILDVLGYKMEVILKKEE